MIQHLHWETVGPAPLGDERDAVAVMREALHRTDEMARFMERAASDDEAILLLVNDGHRATQTRPTLEALGELAAALPIAPRFRAIIATGTHRFPAAERAAFEQATFEDAGLAVEEITWHHPTDGRVHAEIGGVHLNRCVVDSKYLLPIGSVEPHYFAGIAGPHKTMTIGCMAKDDIERNHAHAMDPKSGALCLRGNPVYDGIAEIVRALESGDRHICAIGQVIRGDAVVEAVVGDPLGTVDALLPTVRDLYVRHVSHAVDVLRLRVPLPLGRNLYQADKALKNNHLAVRDGGGIILETECAEGIGPDAFLSLLRRAAGWSEALHIVENEGYRLGDHKAVLLRYLTDPTCRGVHVTLVSPHVDPDEAKVAGITVCPTLDRAIAHLAVVTEGALERGLIVEDAGMVCATPGQDNRPA